MVRAAQRTRRNREVLTTSSVGDSHASVPSMSIASPNANSDAEIETTDLDGTRSIEQSNVWNFATKVSLEKARCNICQIGKYVHQLVGYSYFRREILMRTQTRIFEYLKCIY